ncbi:hypothetical protein LCR01_10050 [Companilactobacillus crustorum]|uniref:TetR family transcriptional regulator n=3 Tax=Companilactobacillus TaxID=2767879 RepID=A0A837RIB1_9LACO|nr:TetR/AcrR family transcriptional regulator [Companilactobacillus crustorum]HCD08535.1 TetR/AcrR family transcriptional regulator [Lactobacillus sp.]APU70567.1 hypothetical protein BI355_0210 [Companilactobacillus crustorum]KRK43395.1 TetR family transcriptional regulator [Companilactobacillus crustorum JCM 15951]KRO20944.1 TetR family transcriptional regulator [Companilactobacillus crustorum]WDT65276.1 TetR/AcrR family transcriptional regulator [Companilactobacillus crustorum]
MVNNIKRKTKKKEAILEAATKIFVRKGYKKTSIALIAKEAEASQVTLYKYYPSKISLARAVVIKLVIDGYTEYGQALNSSKKTFIEKMQDMMKSGVEKADEISDDFVVFMYSEFKGQNGNDEVMKTYNAYKYNFWKNLLDQGRREGVISSKISDEGAMLYLDMFIGSLMSTNPIAEHDPIEIKKHESDLMQLFFYGIIGR